MGWWVAYIAHQDIKNFQIQVHLNAINALIIAIVAITMLQLNLLNALNANMVILYKQTANVYNVAPLLKQELVKYVHQMVDVPNVIQTSQKIVQVYVSLMIIFLVNLHGV